MNRSKEKKPEKMQGLWSFFETRDAIQKFELLKIGTFNWNKRLNDSKINLEK